jgi:hypothetical protein
MTTSDEKVWQPTAVQNLVRYTPSGTYFARFRVGGNLVWKSLKTAMFSVAKQRLPETLRDHRSKIESLTAFAEGKMTVGNAADVYLQKVRASISLEPRSKDYRELMIDFNACVLRTNGFLLSRGRFVNANARHNAVLARFQSVIALWHRSIHFRRSSMPISRGLIFVPNSSTKLSGERAKHRKSIRNFSWLITISARCCNSKDTSAKRSRNFKRRST